MVHVWGGVLRKRLVYLARANAGYALQDWHQFEAAPERPTPPRTPAVAEQGAEALEPAATGAVSVEVQVEA